MKEFPIRPTVLRPLLTGSGKRRDIGDQAEERVAHIFALDGLYNIQVSDKNQLWCLTSEWKSARSMGKRVFEFIQKQSKGYPTMLRSATNVDLRDIEPQFRIRKYETLVTISSCPESMNMSEMSLQDSLDKAYESLAKDDETRHERCDLFAEHIAAKPEAEAEAEAKAGVEVEKAEAEKAEAEKAEAEKAEAEKAEAEKAEAEKAEAEKAEAEKAEAEKAEAEKAEAEKAEADRNVHLNTIGNLLKAAEAKADQEICEVKALLQSSQEESDQLQHSLKKSEASRYSLEQELNAVRDKLKGEEAGRYSLEQELNAVRDKLQGEEAGRFGLEQELHSAQDKLKSEEVSLLRMEQELHSARDKLKDEVEERKTVSASKNTCQGKAHASEQLLRYILISCPEAQQCAASLYFAHSM